MLKARGAKRITAPGRARGGLNICCHLIRWGVSTRGRGIRRCPASYVGGRLCRTSPFVIMMAC